MRIRKHAAKLLLGSGLSHHSPPPPPPSAADVIAAEELYLCQLNCSPWDATDSSLHYFSLQEEGEDEKGITGNGFGFGVDQGEHILGISEAEAITSVGVAEPEQYYNGSGEGVDQKKVKKRRRRRKKEDDQKGVSVIDTKSGGGGGTGCCKKNDGKGWHCKRPANPNHTLCDHHLNQLKSYSARDNGREAYAAANDGDSDSQLTQVKNNQHRPDVPHVKNRKTKTTMTTGVAAAPESAGDGYYYYSGFGPWRGKSRSNWKTAKVKELVEEGNIESDSGEGGSDAPVAGGDLDDDSDVDDKDDGGNVENNMGRKKRGRKKRGRKPVKARSLKSLL